MNHAQLSAAHCPRCGSRYVGIDDGNTPTQPDDGSVSVCVDCSLLSVWTDNAGWVEATGDLRTHLLHNPTVIEVMALATEVAEQQRDDTTLIATTILTAIVNASNGDKLADVVATAATTLVHEHNFHRHHP